MQNRLDFGKTRMRHPNRWLGSGGSGSNLIPLNYYLIDNFTDTDAAPITLPRTADVEGGETGSDTSNLLSVGTPTANVLNVATSAVAATICLYDAQRAREAGLCWMATVNPLSGASTLRGRWGWNNANNTTALDRLAFDAISGSLRARINGSNFAWFLSGALANATPETLAIVQYATRNEFLRLTASGWRLVWVDYSNTDANMYAGYANPLAAIPAFNQSAYRVVPLGASGSLQYAQLVGNISAGATTAARNGNFVIPVDIDTLPSAGTINIRFRRQSGSNTWLLQISSGSSAILYEVVSGIPTLRGSAAITTGKCRIIADGTTIAIYDDDAQLFTYASASNFQTETAIEVSSLGTGGAISDMDVFDRYAFGATDELYDQVNAGLG